MRQRTDLRRRAKPILRGPSPEEELMRALRDADEGLTLGECRTVLRPTVGRNRIEQALTNVRQDSRVQESIERRENRAGRQERYLILRLDTGWR